MIEVSKEVFFQAIGSENIRCWPEATYVEWYIDWHDNSIGKTTPGFKNIYTSEGKTPKKYFLTPQFAKKKGITE